MLIIDFLNNQVKSTNKFAQTRSQCVFLLQGDSIKFLRIKWLIAQSLDKYFA
jgi:hypothetical protein